MKSIIIALALLAGVAAPTVASAAGGMRTCTTQCFGNQCTTTCY